MHVQSPVIAIEGIEDFLMQHRENCSVELTERPDSNWIIRDGYLKHREIDFFEITAMRDEFDQRQLMICQPETALVGLLCSEVHGERYVLVTARCEPGLHGICQLTTTIQSTPSNYLQRHKGASTPFIEYFNTHVDGSRTIHESLQTDWGDYYLGKIKRFHIVEVDELLEVSGSQRWIRLSDLTRLMVHHYAVTSDLRVALLLLHSWEVGTGSCTPTLETIPVNCSARNVDISTLHAQRNQVAEDKYHYLDDYGRSIVFVEFSSASREVTKWSQPLLVIGQEKTIDFWIDGQKSDMRIAVQKGTQVGLQGMEQWFPARVIGDEGVRHNSIIGKVKTSAEGGRFYRHDVQLNLHKWSGESFDGPVEWWSRDEILSVAAKSLVMSIELRMISGLVF